MYNRDTVISEISPYLGFKNEPGYTLPLSLVTTLASRQTNFRWPLLTLKKLDKAREEYGELDQGNTTLFEFLEQSRSLAIDNAIQDIYTLKRLSENMKSTVSRASSLFELHRGNLQPQTLAPNTFVGLKLAPYGSDFFRIAIDRFCLTLLQAQQINLYVYHSSDFFEPYKTIPVNVTKGGSPFWVKAEDLYLDFFNPNLDLGGFYYVGIRTDELSPGNSVLGRKYDNWDKRICGTCAYADKKYQDTWYGFVKMSSFSADTSGEAISGVERSERLTYGLNMGFTVQCDMTKLIVDRKELIAEVAMLKYADLLLSFIENSSRLNREAGVSSDRAYSERFGEWNSAGRAKAKPGLVDEYDKVVKAISFDLSELGDRCLPTDKKRGILKWG